MQGTVGKVDKRKACVHENQKKQLNLYLSKVKAFIDTDQIKTYPYCWWMFPSLPHFVSSILVLASEGS